MYRNEPAQLLKKHAAIKAKIDDAIRRAANADNDKVLQPIIAELRSLRAQQLELEAHNCDGADEQQ